MSLANVKPGDTLHVTRINSARRTHNNAPGGQYVVAKVGRRWITTTRGEQFDRETGMENGHGFSAERRAFASLEALAWWQERRIRENNANQLLTASHAQRWDRLNDAQLGELTGLLERLCGIEPAAGSQR